jgi:calcineurin-like phosphoesterase family protein
MGYFFTADLHLFHGNAIRYCNRPFASAEEMNEAIIERWNSRVGRADTVFVLGDFAFAPRGPVESALRRLKGHKHLVLGNHDSRRVANAKGWEDVRAYKELSIGGRFLVLSHYAMRVWNKSHRGAFHLFGHSHGTAPGLGRSMDVGVDTNDFYPYSFEEVRDRLDTVRVKETRCGCPNCVCSIGVLDVEQYYEED